MSKAHLDYANAVFTIQYLVLHLHCILDACPSAGSSRDLSLFVIDIKNL